MDKNVGNVDINELMRAREELDRERGVETDPNMYSNYNPNRTNEAETQAVATDVSDEMFENSRNLEEEMISGSGDLDADSLISAVSSLAVEPENSAIAETSNENEVLENVESAEDNYTVNVELSPYGEENADAVTIDVSFEQPNETIEPEPVLEEKTPEITAEQKAIMEETSGEVDFSVYDSFADFEVEGNRNIIAEEKPAVAQEIEVSTEPEPQIEEAAETQETASAEEVSDDVEDISAEISEVAENEDGEQTETEVEDVETAVDDVITSFENSYNPPKEEITEETEVESEVETDETEETQEKVSEADEISKLEAQIAELKAKLAENEEAEAEQVEEDNQTAENYALDAEDDYDAINSLMDSLEGLKPIDLTEEEKREIDEKRREAEERRKDEELQIIDDFKKLERLDRILSEDMEEEPQVVVEAAPKISYPEIEAVDFVDIISTEEFKSTDNLSYVLGKDELGTIHYGNLRDFYNMVIYSKDNNSALSAVHSVLVSLILKNSTSDINFVICDSKADSKLQVYNKSSYMYFNRLAKTNKEILDTLIEISKELEERYKILAAAGVKSIEQYNVIAKNDNLKQLPYIVTVFNNYTKSMQLAESDKINTILYQILKLGRIVGLYLIIVGNTKIKSDDINYNLPTRLSFKMSDEEDSLSMLGEGGAEALETDDEFLLLSLDSQKPVHLKVPNVSAKELEVLIKNIEG